MTNPRRLAAVAVIGAALWFLPLVLPSDYFVSLTARFLALAVLAGSFNLLMSYLALTSFGQSALFGVGGYSLAIVLRTAGDVDISMALLAGFAGGGVVAAAIGPFVLRSSGVYFILLSLAVGQVLWGVADSWRSVTGGSDGLIVYALPQLLGWPLDGAVKIFRLSALVSLASILGLYVAVHSSFGSALRGVRESETRMLALGYNVFALRYLAFVLSGAFAGIAGALVAAINRFISPDAMSVRLAVELVLIVILGGRGSFWGPLVASVALFAAEEAISVYTAEWPLVLGLLFIVGVYVLRYDLARIGTWAKARPSAAEP